MCGDISRAIECEMDLGQNHAVAKHGNVGFGTLVGKLVRVAMGRAAALAVARRVDAC